jgi:hypothetical protein
MQLEIIEDAWVGRDMGCEFSLERCQEPRAFLGSIISRHVHQREEYAGSGGSSQIPCTTLSCTHVGDGRHSPAESAVAIFNLGMNVSRKSH